MEKFSCETCQRKFNTKEALRQHSNSTHAQNNLPSVRKRKLAKGRIIGLMVAVLITAGISYFSFNYFTGRSVQPGIYDEFAKCLTEKGAAFYGTYWCPYCREQKNLIGPSMKFINYVECDPRGENAQPGLCAENNVRGYPTWTINGTSYSGVQSLERLSELTTCPLN